MDDSVLDQALKDFEADYRYLEAIIVQANKVLK